MARIQRGEVTKAIIDGCRLDTAREKVPTELAEKVVPVFVSNEKPSQYIVEQATRSTTGDATVYTVPSTGRFFLIAATVSATCTAAADTTSYTIQVQPKGQGTGNILNMLKTTLVAFTDKSAISLSVPIELEPGSVILARHSFTVGASSISGSIVGYYEED